MLILNQIITGLYISMYISVGDSGILQRDLTYTPARLQTGDYKRIVLYCESSHVTEILKHEFSSQIPKTSADVLKRMNMFILLADVGDLFTGTSSWKCEGQNK